MCYRYCESPTNRTGREAGQGQFDVATVKAHRVRLAAQAFLFFLAVLIAPVAALAAPYAALVMDARTGEILYSENADTRLHPASLTKMMTLYIAFQAIERGEISLDTMVKVSAHAAGQAPSKLGLRPGQRIALRHLIRAAAIKSANDAATAISEAISGSEPAFARRMTRTAKSLGMTNSTFKNANGLTTKGHLSSAHDMTVLGRHLFYDFPQYYNIFSRRTADAGVAQVTSTNRRFLDSYPGADGIKTGYTVPAGFNLTASAERGNKRIIATIFGGKSTVWRNQKMAELLDMGFAKAPNRATVQRPVPPGAFPESDPAPEDLLMAEAGGVGDEAVAAAVAEAMTADGSVPSLDADMDDEADGPAAAKTLRVALAVDRSGRPKARPVAGLADSGAVADAEPPPADALAADSGAEAAVASALPGAAAGLPTDGPVFSQTASLQPETLAALDGTPPPAQADETTLAASKAPEPEMAAVPGQSPDAADEKVLAAEADPVHSAAGTTPAVALADASGTAPEVPVTQADAGDTLGLDIDAAVLAAMDDAGETHLAKGNGPAALRPMARPLRPGADDAAVLLADANPTAALAADADIAATPQPVEDVVVAEAVLAPAPREAAAPVEQPPEIILAAATTAPANAPAPEVVTRLSTSGGRQWGINIGRYGSRYEAERMLIQTALVEMATLDDALRKVVGRGGGYDANFVGLTEDSADLACRRLAARAAECTVIPPTG